MNTRDCDVPGILVSTLLFVHDVWDISAWGSSWFLSDLISFFPVCDLKISMRESDFGRLEVDDESILKTSDKQSFATSRLSASLSEVGSTVKQVLVELSIRARSHTNVQA